MWSACRKVVHCVLEMTSMCWSMFWLQKEYVCLRGRVLYGEVTDVEVGNDFYRWQWIPL